MASRDESPRYIGIDLGTTYCAMAWLDAHGRPVTIPNAEDELTTPSVVLFDDQGDVVVGREAKRAALIVPELVADFVKRDMGEAQYHKRINFRFFSPPMISALILKKLKQDAERRIGPVAGAVVTVPAYFDERCRRATAAAGEIAGLKVIDILNEPTAAALAYAFRDFVNKGGNPTDELTRAVATTAPHVAVVYDLGGGTFDVTVLRINGDDLTVLATDGDAKLGGRDWDDRIVEWASATFKKQFRSDPRKDARSLQNLVLAAEEAKKDLSRLQRTRLMINHGGQSMPLELTREEFERLTADLLERTRERVNLVIEEAGLHWGEVHEMLAVGGSSRMPMVLRMLRDVTGKEPNCSLPPGEAVAHGAAIHAAIKAIDLWKIQQAGGSVDALMPPTAPLDGEPPEPALDPFSGIQGPEEESDGIAPPPVDDWDEEGDGDFHPNEATREAMLESMLSRRDDRPAVRFRPRDAVRAARARNTGAREENRRQRPQPRRDRHPQPKRPGQIDPDPAQHPAARQRHENLRHDDRPPT